MCALDARRYRRLFRGDPTFKFGYDRRIAAGSFCKSCKQIFLQIVVISLAPPLPPHSLHCRNVPLLQEFHFDEARQELPNGV